MFLGVSNGIYRRFEISNASLSTIRVVSKRNAQLAMLNDTLSETGLELPGYTLLVGNAISAKKAMKTYAPSLKVGGVKLTVAMPNTPWSPKISPI
jgi:hypothetical protein